jgi:hypothetical protein
LSTNQLALEEMASASGLFAHQPKRPRQSVAGIVDESVEKLRFPNKAELASLGLEDSVESVTTGLSSWALIDLAGHRERAFAGAGGKNAEQEQRRARAAEVRRTLLRRSTPPPTSTAPLSEYKSGQFGSGFKSKGRDFSSKRGDCGQDDQGGGGGGNQAYSGPIGAVLQTSKESSVNNALTDPRLR